MIGRARSTTMAAHVSTFGDTRAGRVRSTNQDAFHVGSAADRPLLVVADGMGGHKTGEVASALATETVARHLDRAVAHAPVALVQAVRAAHLEIFGRARSDPRFGGMGTTLTVVWIDGSIAWIAHIGDSRAAMLRGDTWTELTDDHSWVADRVRQGLLSTQEARDHRWRNVITNALGTRESVRLDLRPVHLRPGDRLLVSSDGVTSLLHRDVLAVHLAADDPTTIVSTLLDLADERGSPDNATAAVCIVHDVPTTASAYDLGDEETWSVTVDGTDEACAAAEARYPLRGPLGWARRQAWYPYRAWIVGSAYMASMLVAFLLLR